MTYVPVRGWEGKLNTLAVEMQSISWIWTIKYHIKGHIAY